MSKNIRTLYLYIVSFITLFMMLGSIVAIVSTTVSYFYPVVNYYYDSGSYNETKMNDETGEFIFNNQMISSTNSYVEGFRREEAKQKTINLKNIFTSISVLLVSSPLFIYHWSRIEKERKEGEVSKVL